jgi:hypothetical protein
MNHALSDDYFPYIISALIVFDMQRQMGKGLKAKFDKSAHGFAAKLSKALEANKEILFSLENISIDSNYLSNHEENIKKVYQDMAVDLKLAEQDKEFHVGATKILHFVHPELFPIVDSNSAAILRDEFRINYARSGQPGYSSDKYFESMQSIGEYVRKTGRPTLQELEPGTPITRIFDKLAFVKGAELK